jgi:uncharacterized damage-inducible protein DinB
MAEIDRIRDQLSRSFNGGAWHGPAILEVLDGVAAKQAAKRPIENAHTIWEILLHLSTTTGEVLARLTGEGRFDIPLEEDWPVQPPEPTDEAWYSDIERLRILHAEMTQGLSRINDSHLDEPILDGFSSTYITIHGQVQHNIYHAAQIVLLKKALLK